MRTRQLPENFRDWIKSPTIAIDSRMLAPQHREKPERGGSAENTAAAGSGNDVLGDRRLRHTWNGRRKTTCQHLEPMALSLTPHASSKINLMTTVVGISDNALDLDRAVERLARAGFRDTWTTRGSWPESRKCRRSSIRARLRSNFRLGERRNHEFAAKAEPRRGRESLQGSSCQLSPAQGSDQWLRDDLQP